MSENKSSRQQPPTSNFKCLAAKHAMFAPNKKYLNMFFPRQWLYSWNKTTRFLSPAILISRFLLRIRRMYAASITLKRSFGIPPRMYGMHRTHFDHCAFEPSISILSLVIWSRVFWPCVKLTQSTALEPKRFDLRSLSPLLHNIRGTQRLNIVENHLNIALLNVF